MGNVCLKNQQRSILFCNDINKKKKTKKLLEWNSNYPTIEYHWWPMKMTFETDTLNNLYSKGGGLYLYDKLFNTKSVEYQKKNYMISSDSKRSDKNWAGFCDKATMLSCLYEYPKNNVIVKYKSKKVKFTKKNIEMLMIISSENAIESGCFLFLGKRFNNKPLYGEDKNEPYPLDLLHMLKIISLEKEPFAIDIDNGTSVWNYAFDKILVFKSSECSMNHTKPDTTYVEYYNFIIKSNAYPDKNIDIWGYIGFNDIKDYNNKINIKQGWISEKHPDFIWKSYKLQKVWEGPCKVNPQIDAQIVHAIYKHSLKDSNKELDLGHFDVLFR